jgi:hypothetical protein
MKISQNETMEGIKNERLEWKDLINRIGFVEARRLIESLYDENKDRFKDVVNKEAEDQLLKKARRINPDFSKDDLQQLTELEIGEKVYQNNKKFFLAEAAVIYMAQQSGEYRAWAYPGENLVLFDYFDQYFHVEGFYFLGLKRHGVKNRPDRYECTNKNLQKSIKERKKTKETVDRNSKKAEVFRTKLNNKLGEIEVQKLKNKLNALEMVKLEELGIDNKPVLYGLSESNKCQGGTQTEQRVNDHIKFLESIPICGKTAHVYTVGTEELYQKHVDLNHSDERKFEECVNNITESRIFIEELIQKISGSTSNIESRIKGLQSLNAKTGDINSQSKVRKNSDVISDSTSAASKKYLKTTRMHNTKGATFFPSSRQKRSSSVQGVHKESKSYFSLK